MKCYDYECDCGLRLIDYLVESEKENVRCTECGQLMRRLHPAPRQFSTIVPDYPGSKAQKAGHAHRFVNRPAEKTQVGYGGSVSANHPTGGGKGSSS